MCRTENDKFLDKNRKPERDISLEPKYALSSNYGLGYSGLLGGFLGCLGHTPKRNVYVRNLRILGVS